MGDITHGLSTFEYFDLTGISKPALSLQNRPNNIVQRVAVLAGQFAFEAIKEPVHVATGLPEIAAQANITVQFLPGFDVGEAAQFARDVSASLFVVILRVQLASAPTRESLRWARMIWQGM